jgi:hypothetical protein
MAGMLRVSRSRGALSGVLLILLGAWGGLIPFVGPSFHYAYTPDKAWTYTTGRLWLEILPAVAVVVGGLIVLVSGLRPTAMFGAWLAAIGGAWFAVGTVLAPLWTAGITAAQGVPIGGTMLRTVEQIGFFTGLGVVVVFVAAVALGRLSVVAVRDLAAGRGGEPVPVREEPVTAAEEPATAADTPDPTPAGDMPVSDPVRADAGAGRHTRDI